MSEAKLAFKTVRMSREDLLSVLLLSGWAWNPSENPKRFILSRGKYSKELDGFFTFEDLRHAIDAYGLHMKKA